MSESEKILTKRTLVILGIISVIIFVVGSILIFLGYNEAFYVENPVVQAFFLFITNAGTPIFYIVIVCVFYYALDKKFARRLGIIIAASGIVNITLKEIFKDPRPLTNITWADERGFVEEGYGFPSGHTQVSLTTWGYVANEYKDRAEPSFLLPIILSGFIFLITISRIIIGVHDLQDIIGGLLIGIGFLIAYLYLEPVASKKIESLSFSKKIILATIVPIILLIITLILFPDEDYAMLVGVLFGLCIGFVLEDKFVKYDTTVLNGKQKFINLVLGLVFLLIPFVVFELLFEGTLLLIFIEFSLLSFIMSFVIPLIFTKINRIKKLF